MGLFSLIGGLIGGNAQAKASKKAAQLQYDAAQQGIAEQRREYDLTRSDYQPWITTGTQALGGQGDLLGLNGADAQQAAITALQGSPLYQSLYRNGQEAVLQNASATGGLRGGNTERSLANFGADTLSQVIQQQLANLGGLSGGGQTAVTGASNAGQASTNNIINLLNGGAAAQAGSILTRGGIAGQNWSNAGSFLDNAISSIFGGGF